MQDTVFQPAFLLEAGVIEQVGRGKVKYSVAYLKEYLERIAD